ncbi:Putative lipoprotein [Actinoplanes sp. SE50]|uniref:hypothetical protein n=1 Tax=unclassified Actinoplanes TaxID=2626549 RepID=UPI00023EC9E2|nr:MULTISPECIES: hypothetical protein [unclassified Actinoplanes]AEV86494.1 Putative lipoprotein [Actinoplanes sp. SE50/110]ATO84892.1 Putative lipoprotein [Actinoplanes sp. SE50]SLM02301.1 uncharacterized protein ACSP50_5540 [Actinoplanes sp. SE50/110]
MRVGRLAVTGVALVALTGLTACNDKAEAPAAQQESAPAAVAAPTGAAKELAAAATKLTATSGKVHMTMAGGLSGNGSFDTAEKVVDMRMTMPGLGDVSVRQIGTDMWMRFGGAAAKTFAGGKWMHIDAGRMPASSSLSMAKNDPRNSAKMLAASTDVAKTGPHAYTGTIDISKTTTLTTDMLKALEGRNTKVPFTAEVDGGGYLSRMSLDMDAVTPGAGKIVAEYSGIGTPVSVAAPAPAETVEMPDTALKAMGG